MYVGVPVKAVVSHVVLVAAVRTARYSSAGTRVPDVVELASVIVPPTVEAAVVRMLTHAYCETDGDIAVALNASEAPGAEVLLAHTPATVLDSVVKVLAANEPVAFSESVHDARVIVAPTPNTKAPASTARTRVKVRRLTGARCLATVATKLRSPGIPRFRQLRCPGRALCSR
jgi:hypothetical protein